MAASLGDTFAASLDEKSGAKALGAEVLKEADALLGQAFGLGRGEWPEVALAPEDFARHIASHAPHAPKEDLLAWLRQAHLRDLYLAAACALRLPSAIETFERTYFYEVDRAFARSRPPAAALADVRQMVRERLFVTEHGKEKPRIADYSGKGQLKSWFKVAVLRLLTNLATRGPKEEPGDEELFEHLVAPNADPEQTKLKERYQHELKQAFAQAIASLEPKDRTLLRQVILDGLTIDELGELHAVHRSTAARWVNAIRAVVADRVRRAVGERLGLELAQVDSVVRLVQSQIDLSFDRLLKTPA